MPMHLAGKSFRKFTGAFLAVLALTIISQAQEATSQNSSTVNIKNFGQMDERFYRGAQPKEKDYKDLAAIGIKTIIDLTAEPKPYEKAAVEALGMKYVNIPMIEKKYPTEEATKMFLKWRTIPRLASSICTVPAADTAPEQWARFIVTSFMIGTSNRRTPR